MNCDIYRQPMKMREGNVFTCVCLSTGGWGETHRLRWVLTPGGGYSLPEGEYSPLKIHGPGILRGTVDKRAVHILLECFLDCCTLILVFQNLRFVRGHS